MSETDARPVRGGGLVAEAAAIFDGTPAIAAAARATGPTFESGAEWMRATLGALRGEVPRGTAAFATIGCVKYGVAAIAAALPLALAAATRSAWPLLLVVPAFYAAEVQAVFAFPAALDGATHPIAASRRIVRDHGGTLRSMAIVIAIAAYMLGGGFAGRGFRRSWCVGCLAVLLWYERWRPAGPSDLAPVPR